MVWKVIKTSLFGGALIALGSFVFFVFYTVPSTDRLCDYINQNGENVAYGIVENGKLIAAHNTTKLMPIASMVKLIIAIEVAHQAGQGELNVQEQVPVATVNQLEIIGTDGDAHQNWLKQQVGESDSVSLLAIARGMIEYSSNANTEYLMQVLTLERINARLDSLGVTTEHSPLFFFPSSALLPLTYEAAEPDQKISTVVSGLSVEDYHRKSEELFQLRKLGQMQGNKVDFDSQLQIIWRDRLPRSNVNAYLRLAAMCNSRAAFPTAVHEVLDEIMNYKQMDRLQRIGLKSLALKGGSAFGLRTKVMYFRDEQDNSYEIVYIFNEIDLQDYLKLKSTFHEFDFKVLVEKNLLCEISMQ